jgi:hypothetical protein
MQDRRHEWRAPVEGRCAWTRPAAGDAPTAVTGKQAADGCAHRWQELQVHRIERTNPDPFPIALERQFWSYNERDEAPLSPMADLALRACTRTTATLISQDSSTMPHFPDLLVLQVLATNTEFRPRLKAARIQQRIRG